MPVHYVEQLLVTGLFVPSPLRGRGLGRGGFLRTRQGNNLLHPLQIAQYFRIPKSQDPKALRLKPGSPLRLVRLVFGVLTAIHFDDQASLETHKIDKITPNRPSAGETYGR